MTQIEGKRRPKRHIVSLSGGKDSTAMLLRMIEEQYPIDEILFCDTGMEFPDLYAHLNLVEQKTGHKITRLKSPLGFDYYFSEHTPKRKNPALKQYRGMSWPGPQARWCTGRLKTDIINQHLKKYAEDFEVVQYIGIAADEAQRVKEHRYPLVEWGMTERDCLRYCYERGYDWGGLYEIFKRVSCWCCPLQSLPELKKLREHYPELWAKLREMDDSTWRTFKEDYSVRRLDVRFDLENLFVTYGKSPRCREFFRTLNFLMDGKEVS